MATPLPADAENAAPVQLEIVQVLIGDLTPNIYNPNQQSIDSFDLLVKSIETDGFTLPVVVNSGVTHTHLRNMIIDGEHRWRAASVLGMPAVPVVYKDMDEAGMRASTIRHNKARGHHDALLEARVLSELVGQIGADELSAGLNIDPVELEVMLVKAQDFTTMEDLAALSEPAALETLASRGVTGDMAQIVAKRHGMADVGSALAGQNTRKLASEAGTSVRVELVYSDLDAEFMRSIVASYGGAHDAILLICSNSGITG